MTRRQERTLSIPAAPRSASSELAHGLIFAVVVKAATMAFATGAGSMITLWSSAPGEVWHSYPSRALLCSLGASEATHSFLSLRHISNFMSAFLVKYH